MATALQQGAYFHQGRLSRAVQWCKLLTKSSSASEYRECSNKYLPPKWRANPESMTFSGAPLEKHTPHGSCSHPRLLAQVCKGLAGGLGCDDTGCIAMGDRAGAVPQALQTRVRAAADDHAVQVLPAGIQAHRMI
eukprot:983598-Pelagomonas_calceolata.AAC.2